MKTEREFFLSFCPSCGFTASRVDQLRQHLAEFHCVGPDELDRVATRLHKQVLWLRRVTSERAEFRALQQRGRRHSTQAQSHH